MHWKFFHYSHLVIIIIGSVLFSGCYNKRERYLNQGRAKAENKQYLQSIVWYDKVIQMDTADALAYYYRAMARMNLRPKEIHSALDDFSKAIKIDTGMLLAYHNRGKLLNQIHSPFDAIADQNRALEIDPGLKDAYTVRGLAKQCLYSYIEAIDDFNKVIGLNPEDPEAWFNRAQVRLLINDSIGAMDDFSRTIALDSTNALAHYWRGMVRIQTCCKDEGCRDLWIAFDLGYRDAFNAIQEHCFTVEWQGISNLHFLWIKAMEERRLVDSVRSNYYTKLDSIELSNDIGFTVLLSRNEYNTIVDSFPSFYRTVVEPPEITYGGYEKLRFLIEGDADKSNFGMVSLQGEDYYYFLYSHFLKQKNGISKYAEIRGKLSKLYYWINELEYGLALGGTAYDHQQARISAYVEYEIYQYSKGIRTSSNTKAFNSQKNKYVKCLRNIIAEEASDPIAMGFSPEDVPDWIRKLNGIVDTIGQLIVNNMYLQKAKEFSSYCN